jgi:hypothetical protein
MFRFACLSALTMIALLAAQPASPPPSPAPVEAGGCGWWVCSTTGETTPSSFVCAAGCPLGTCKPINVCQ